jgi:hypothetical protein
LEQINGSLITKNGRVAEEEEIYPTKTSLSRTQKQKERDNQDIVLRRLENFGLEKHDYFGSSSIYSGFEKQVKK